MKSPKLPKIDHAGIASRLEALREAIDLDKGGFAQSFGVDPSSYSKMLKGEKPLKADMAYVISERWGVTMDYLYRGNLDRLPDRYAKILIDKLTSR